MFGLNPRLKVVEGSVRGYTIGEKEWIQGFLVEKCPACGKENAGYRPITHDMREGIDRPFLRGPGYFGSNWSAPNLYQCASCGNEERLSVELDTSNPKPSKSVAVLSQPEQEVREPKWWEIPRRVFKMEGRQIATWKDFPGDLVVELKIKYERDGWGYRKMAKYANKLDPTLRASKDSMQTLVKAKGWVRHDREQ